MREGTHTSLLFARSPRNPPLNTAESRMSVERSRGKRRSPPRSDDRLEEIYDVAAAVELDVRTIRIAVGALSQPLEGGCDQPVDGRRLTLEPDPGVAPARQSPQLQLQRLRVVTVTDLDAGSVFVGFGSRVP
jgi:hypothetical protein